MTASASYELEREDFALSLSRFARSLCARTDLSRRDGSGFRPAEAINEALATSAGTNDGAERRALAYRIVVRRFLDESDARPGGAFATARPSTAANSGSAAVQSRPVEFSQTLEALGRLAPVERAALLLVAVEAFSHRDAANLMDMDESGFVAALARGREAFAARLAAAASPGKPHLKLVE